MNELFLSCRQQMEGENEARDFKSYEMSSTNITVLQLEHMFLCFSFVLSQAYVFASVY